ncbi:lysophospholipase L1-like esterase [Lewinella aquimaris]|uniref:Lysophospholipase L1-like esterase n=1 Tax=Neolewinella aquimaris TaxID=1835722 RepID=A0A840E8J2_9BACT|nr:hypothetical protein [Neolewinella aquimaris]MBB4080253.1 lysophospholipase L1-like esterase [Neolewinella aquimaris]
MFALLCYPIGILVWESLAPDYLKPNIRWRPATTGYLYSRLVEADTVTNVDILFMGSSHAYRGFNTQYFHEKGYKSFVLGSKGQTPLQGKLLLEKYLNRFNPKLVVYEVYPVIFAIDGVESMLDVIANGELDESTIELALTYWNPIVWNTLTYGIIERNILGETKETEPSETGDDKYWSGGYVETIRTNASEEEFPPNEIFFREDQLEAFKQMIQILKDRKIETILVFAPVTKNYYRTLKGIDSFSSVMDSLATYYNFNDIDLNLNDSIDYYDHHHFNKSGVRKFNEALLDTIQLHLSTQPGHLLN